MKASWDIFCSVVDNYGDIGVTWRLARQLVAEHQVPVRLWVDDVQAFVPLCPEADASAAQQWQQGVEVRVWPKDWQPVEVADVVIEAFACTLPDSYRLAMKARETPVLWINLEYLSAEDWVSGCHGLPSLRPDGLKRMFFFPGFDAGTGGLLREADLLARRRAFEQDPQARQAFLQGLGVFAGLDHRADQLAGWLLHWSLPAWHERWRLHGAVFGVDHWRWPDRPDSRAADLPDRGHDHHPRSAGWTQGRQQHGRRNCTGS